MFGEVLTIVAGVVVFAWAERMWRDRERRGVLWWRFCGLSMPLWVAVMSLAAGLSLGLVVSERWLELWR